MIGLTHNFKVPAFVRGVLWTIEGAAKMERRVVDEIDIDVRRLVIFAVWASTISRVGREQEIVGRTGDLFVHSTKPCVGHDIMQDIMQERA
jgi:hypothetical protein